MNSKFLEVDGIKTEADAIRWSVNAAVQRNRVYRGYERREEFRAEWKRMIREESQRYRSLDEPMCDSQHCGIISMISDHLSATFATSLNNGRLRFGTSQKAFNLYLKYLFGNWVRFPHHHTARSTELSLVRWASTKPGRSATIKSSTCDGSARFVARFIESRRLCPSRNGKMTSGCGRLKSSPLPDLALA